MTTTATTPNVQPPDKTFSPARFWAGATSTLIPRRLQHRAQSLKCTTLLSEGSLDHDLESR